MAFLGGEPGGSGSLGSKRKFGGGKDRILS